MGNLSSHSKHQAAEPATPSHTLTQDATRQIHIAAPLYSLMLPVATSSSRNLSSPSENWQNQPKRALHSLRIPSKADLNFPTENEAIHPCRH